MAVFSKIGLKGIDSTLATTIRSIIMAIFLVMVSLGFGKFHNFTGDTLSTKAWVYIVLAGISGALSWLFYFFALDIGKASHVTAVDRLSVVITLVLAAFFLGEALGWKSAVGGVLMVAGAIMIALQ